MSTDSDILGPDSIAWRVASDARLYLGAGNALLLQVAHPTVGSGVRDFSKFEEEPWDRLFRTIDYVNLSVYGGAEAPLVGRRLRAAHKGIRGVNPDGSRYSALEPEAYAWVHATLADSIVAGQAMLGSPLSRDEVERFYQEWRGIGRFIGVRDGDLPADWAGFRAYYDDVVANRLVRNETVDRVLRAITRTPRPNLPFLPEAVWRAMQVLPSRALWLAAVGPLPPILRDRFGIRWTALHAAEFRAMSLPLRALTPILPKSARITGPAYLRWRRRAIAKGALGPGAEEPAAKQSLPI